jgi:hypothetical protein
VLVALAACAATVSDVPLHIGSIALEPRVDVSQVFDFPAHSVVQLVNTARRLQTGYSALTIMYTISCATNCDDVNAFMNNIASNPAAGATHAQQIIDSINALEGATKTRVILWTVWRRTVPGETGAASRR